MLPTTKVRYAVVALSDLAKNKPGQVVPITDIAKRQEISLAYLEQLFVKLRQAGVVESVRGFGGGFRLNRPAQEISIWEIMLAVEEQRCRLPEGELSDLERQVGSEISYLNLRFWHRYLTNVEGHLRTMSLADATHEELGSN